MLTITPKTSQVQPAKQSKVLDSQSRSQEAQSKTKAQKNRLPEALVQLREQEK